MIAPALGAVMSLFAVLPELAASRSIEELALAIQFLELAELGPLIGWDLVTTGRALACTFRKSLRAGPLCGCCDRRETGKPRLELGVPLGRLADPLGFAILVFGDLMTPLSLDPFEGAGGLVR